MKFFCMVPVAWGALYRTAEVPRTQRYLKEGQKTWGQVFLLDISRAGEMQR